MIIKKASLIKFYDENVGTKQFAVILEYDADASREIAYAPISEKKGREVVKKYVGAESLPEHKEIVSWGSQSCRPDSLPNRQTIQHIRAEDLKMEAVE